MHAPDVETLSVPPEALGEQQLQSRAAAEEGEGARESGASAGDQNVLLTATPVGMDVLPSEETTTTAPLEPQQLQRHLTAARTEEDIECYDSPADERNAMLAGEALVGGAIEPTAVAADGSPTSPPPVLLLTQSDIDSEGDWSSPKRQSSQRVNAPTASSLVSDVAGRELDAVSGDDTLEVGVEPAAVEAVATESDGQLQHESDSLARCDTAVDESSNKWVEYVSEAGDRYFYNPQSHESRWTHPDDGSSQQSSAEQLPPTQPHTAHDSLLITHETESLIAEEDADARLSEPSPVHSVAATDSVETLESALAHASDELAKVGANQSELSISFEVLYSCIITHCL